MPVGSTVVIKYDGNDITTDVLFATARFESQINAVPGTFSFTIKDTEHVYSLNTGRTVTLEIDGFLAYGGFVLQIQRTYPFSAMDTTSTPPEDTARYFRILGVDFNLLFDKRVLRNTADYTHHLPNFTGEKMDGFLIKYMADNWLDVEEVDTETFVEDIRPPFNGTPDSSKKGAWLQQGSLWRKQMEDFAQFSGAIWYLAPKIGGPEEIELHYHAIESVLHRWGFSDVPNKATTVTTTPGYQNATIGPREIDVTEAGDHMVNDAFVWGGSQWAGTGGTVFAREENSSSISTHGRWQLAETHFGETGYKLQEGVDVRADIIVNGPPGAVAADQNRGLRFPQYSVRLGWFAHLVPTMSGVPNHIAPGSIVHIKLQVFGNSFELLLPMRSVTITFPDLDPTGQGYVRYDGMFGLQPDDPYSLWRFLLNLKNRTQNGALTFVDQDSTATVYGATGNFVPTPAANGSATVFSVPFGYIQNSTKVYLRVPGATGALLLLRGTDYSESDPIDGEITMNVAPPTGSTILINCRTLAA